MHTVGSIEAEQFHSRKGLPLPSRLDAGDGTRRARSFGTLEEANHTDASERNGAEAATKKKGGVRVRKHQRRADQRLN